LLEVRGDDVPDDGPPDTWVISRHEVPARIEFVRINARRVKGAREPAAILAALGIPPARFG